MRTIFDDKFFLVQITSIITFLLFLDFSFLGFDVGSIIPLSQSLIVLAILSSISYYMMKHHGLWMIKNLQITMLGLIASHFFRSIYLLLISHAVLLITLALSVFIPPNIGLAYPRGKYSVIGTSTFHLKDKSRKFPFEENKEREMIVQTWYPSSKDKLTKKSKLSKYATSNFNAILDGLIKIMNIPSFVKFFSSSFDFYSNSFDALPVVTSGQKFPIVFFSHGLSGTRFQNRYLFEELASFGYMVISVEHPGDSLITIFPDGRTVPFTLGKPKINDETREKEFKKYSEYLETRLGDVCFVHDVFSRLNDGDLDFFEGVCVSSDCDSGVLLSFQNSLNFDQVGIVGHSYGAATAIYSSYKFPEKFKACVALDIWCFPLKEEVLSDEIQSHKLFVSSDLWQWEKNKNLLLKLHSQTKSRSSFNLTLKATDHQNFSDLSIIIPKLAKMLKLIGPASSVDCSLVTNNLTISFFEKFLLGKEDKKVPFISVLNKNPQLYPEIIWD
eukprot:TRINITY_DN10357_c0_g1_i2.p1 TRINITY_DN10357_c0_g1~~TRINITY_DN10357_c0_g1_i2.p1  ORF type:complete len:500 (-),score=116.75 TRINITY_DN10357_c0_g1_i2:42-1541(-)